MVLLVGFSLVLGSSCTPELAEVGHTTGSKPASA